MPDLDYFLVRNNSDAPIELDSSGRTVAPGAVATVRDLDTGRIVDALAAGSLEVVTEHAFRHDPGLVGPITTGAGIERSGRELELDRQNREGGLRW